MAQNPNLSKLDDTQILNRVFDPLNDRLRTDAQITGNISGPQEIIINHVDDSISIGDGTDLVTTTTVGADVGLDVNVIGGSVSISGAITGEFTPTGLRTAIKITTMNITDTATPLPATALFARNAMVVTNKDITEVLYVGPASVTADTVVGTTSGHEVNPGEGFNLDIQDDIVLYGIAPAGKTILVKITELA